MGRESWGRGLGVSHGEHGLLVSRGREGDVIIWGGVKVGGKGLRCVVGIHTLDVEYLVVQ